MSLTTQASERVVRSAEVYQLLAEPAEKHEAGLTISSDPELARLVSC